MDPRDYDKNRDIRPDSGWKILQALVTVTLIVCGLIGIAVRLFASDMTPYDWWQWITASTFNTILAFLAVIAVIIFHRYITHISTEKRRNASNLPVYIMMLVGVYFIYHLLTTGHW